MTILIDNYDSFSHNLFQLFGTLGVRLRIIRNDELSADEVLSLRPKSIVISPGPGTPKEAGICIELIRKVAGLGGGFGGGFGESACKILGVCLGHQAINEAFGGEVGLAKKLMHGKSSFVRQTAKTPIFAGLDERFEVARYHSLAVTRLASGLRVTSVSEEGEVMSFEHESLPVYGVQFHPESILTPQGKTIVKNFLML